MNRSSALRQQLGIWALILGLWFLLVTAFSGALVFWRSIPWQEALRLSFLNWYPWVILGPAAAWLAFKFPIEKPRWPVSIPVHLAACLLAVLISEQLIGPAPSPPGPPTGAGQARRQFRDGNANAPFPPPGRDLDRPEGQSRGEGQPPLGLAPRRQFFVNALVLHAQINIPIYWVIVSISHALMFYQRSQRREKRALELEGKLAEAKLEALRMQLHPHFLFNTLNAISTLVHKDANAADEMIANLSELLRATLDTQEQEIPLRKEIEFLDYYLEIQQVRFGSRLRVEKELDAKALECYVPTLILQPLVENAIRHGLEPKTGGGCLSIRAMCEPGVVRLTVKDDGAGSKVSGGSPSHAGIGIANTRARLKELYGDRARLMLASASDGGFAAEITLPFRDAPAPAVKPEEHEDSDDHR
jgi:hypothetical protein